MNLTFYIIYTPKSFSKLKLAIRSLLKFTPHNYVLVANGLEEEEYQTIYDFSKLHIKLSSIDLPGNVTIPHGTALTHLFITSKEEYFCFMDSDIFAFGDFSDQLYKLIENNDVVSSCKPLEWLVKESPRGYRGHCTVSPSGKNIAMTYFSIYRRDKVTPILNQYNINFERYMRKSQVPNSVFSVLSKTDRYTWKFNTAKLLNIIQANLNYKFIYQEFDSLIHLGGISRYSEHTIQGTRKINLKNPYALDRVATRKYFHDLLENLEKNSTNLPGLEIADPALFSTILNVSNRLIELHNIIEQD